MRIHAVELCNHARECTLPTWAQEEGRHNVLESHKLLLSLLAWETPPRIYGVNRLVGHMDHEIVSKERAEQFQAELIRNHALGVRDSVSEFMARCVGYAKLAHFAQGDSAVSVELYGHLCGALCDEAFRPRVPRGCSYSCGDVIPGAEWALGLVEYGGYLKRAGLRPKEGISLINGSFVQVGMAMGLFPRLSLVWRLFLDASLWNAKVCMASPTNYYANENRLEGALGARFREILDLPLLDRPQDPVSLRALPQVAATLGESLRRYVWEVETALSHPSDNPLICATPPHVRSQASFLVPGLTLATSSVLECLLLMMWTVVSRVHYLMSGKVPDVPLNGCADSGLGFIQVPKLAMAILEEARYKAGRRAFASGADTSYGVEDLWTHGKDLTENLDEVADLTLRLLAIEMELLHAVSPVERRVAMRFSELATGCAEGAFRDRVTALCEQIRELEHRPRTGLFPLVDED